MAAGGQGKAVHSSPGLRGQQLLQQRQQHLWPRNRNRHAAAFLLRAPLEQAMQETGGVGGGRVGLLGDEVSEAAGSLTAASGFSTGIAAVSLAT